MNGIDYGQPAKLILPMDEPNDGVPLTTTLASAVLAFIDLSLVQQLTAMIERDGKETLTSDQIADIFRRPDFPKV